MGTGHGCEHEHGCENVYFLIALSSQQDFRCSVLKSANTKWRAASTAECALNDAAQTDICNLCQILSGIKQNILGLEVHVDQLHSNRQPQARPCLAYLQMQQCNGAYISRKQDAGRAAALVAQQHCEREVMSVEKQKFAVMMFQTLLMYLHGAVVHRRLMKSTKVLCQCGATVACSNSDHAAIADDHSHTRQWLQNLHL